MNFLSQQEGLGSKTKQTCSKLLLLFKYLLQYPPYHYFISALSVHNSCKLRRRAREDKDDDSKEIRQHQAGFVQSWPVFSTVATLLVMRVSHNDRCLVFNSIQREDGV